MGEPQKQGGVANLSDIVQNNGQSQSGNVASFDDVAPAQPPAAAPATDRPGLLHRFAEAVGIPTSWDQVSSMIPSKEELVKSGLNPVTALANKTLKGYVSNLKQQSEKGVQEVKEAKQNIKEGGPVLPNIGKQMAAGTEWALRGVLSPFGGNIPQNLGEDVFQGNVPAATGDVLGAVTLALMGKAMGGPSAEKTSNRLAWATKGDQPAILNTLNDVKTAAANRGQPINTVGDYLNAIKDAKYDMNTESGTAIQPIADRTYIPFEIAERIKSLRQPWMDVHPDGAVIKQKILDAALPFESKEWSYRQLDNYRTQLQQQLSSYYKKGGVDRYAELKTDPSTAIDRQIVDGIQDLVYPQMDAQLGKPAGYFAALKQRQSNLITLEKQVSDSLANLQQKTAEIKGGPRFGENASLYQSGIDKAPGFSLHKMQDVIRKPNPLGKANAYVGKAFTGGSPTATGALYTLPIRYLLFNLPSAAPSATKTPEELRQKAQELTQ